MGKIAVGFIFLSGAVLCRLRIAILKATPHKDCATDAKSDFSSDCTMTTQEYLMYFKEE
jgi:hypothetical protein